MPAPDVALFTGLLAGSADLLASARDALAREWGPVALASTPRAWTESDYYEAEMGKGLLRQFLLFERLVGADRLPALKRRAIVLEAEFAKGAAVPRPVNVDPGTFDANILTLASTKRGGHRVWIGDDLWAEITLVYRGGSWQPLEWTYPDFRRADTQEFLAAARRRMLPALRP